MSVNKVILIGNLTADPELRYTASGTAVATLGVATNKRWKDKQGEQQEEVEYHRVIVWAQSAEYCGEYMKKGNKIYCEGSLKTRKWQDQSGNDKWTTEIIAQSVQNLSPRQNNEEWQTKQDRGRDEVNGGAMTTGDDVPFIPCF